MENRRSSLSRSRFVVWGLGVLASFTALRFFNTSKGAKSGERKKVKMLTQDGKLVEIDEDLLKTDKRKITNKELQSWVKK